MKWFATAVAVLTVLLASSTVQGQSRYSANGHYYELVQQNVGWSGARDAAAKKTYSGMKGYLVTITTSGENEFVTKTVLSGNFMFQWIGAFQGPNPVEPSGGWEWVSGEKWSYTNWDGGTPSNFGGPDVAAIRGGTGLWSVRRAWYGGYYIVEYEPIATVVIDSDTPSASSSDVTLTLEFESGDDAGTPQVRFRNGTGTWSEWSKFSTSASWTLTVAEGTRTVEAEFKDAYGLVYSATDSIQLDWTGPTGGVSIESGADWTNSQAVALDLTYSDTWSAVASMRFRSPGEDWGDWLPAAPSASFTLTSGEGLRTVEAQFRDEAGNLSLTARDSIEVDQTPPGVELVADEVNAFVPSRHVPFEILVTDSASGAESMRFREVGFIDVWDPWIPFSSTQIYTVRHGEGPKTLEVQVRDRAGNVAGATSNTVTLDITAPWITHFRVSRGAPWVLPGFPVDVDLSALDNAGGSGPVEFRLSYDRGDDWSPWRGIYDGGLLGVDRPEEDGLVLVWAMIRDGVDNRSGADEWTTYLVEENLPVASGGGKLTGTLSPAADVDAFAVDLAKGDILTVKAKGKSGSGGEELILAIDLASATDGPLHAGRYPAEAKSVMIKGFVAPATDRYYVLLRLDSESAAKSGAHSLSAKVKQNKFGKKGKGVSDDGRIPFDAVDGSLLKATVKGEGLTAAHVTLMGPDGPVTFTAKEGKGSVKLEATLDAGTGTYEIAVDPAVEVSWKWKLKLPKKVKAEIRQ